MYALVSAGHGEDPINYLKGDNLSLQRKAVWMFAWIQLVFCTKDHQLSITFWGQSTCHIYCGDFTEGPFVLHNSSGDWAKHALSLWVWHLEPEICEDVKVCLCMLQMTKMQLLNFFFLIEITSPENHPCTLLSPTDPDSSSIFMISSCWIPSAVNHSWEVFTVHCFL